ncbi:MAG TPA: alpha/beta fold hydrolase [Propionibacteriaceae bacterium]|jgi:pimeloyl-ACP methyl ester carboxylesterase
MTYEVGREVDDVAAVAAEAGGGVHVYGHSAASALALRAAAAGVGIDRLVLADPSFTPPGSDEAGARAEHTEQTQHIEQLNGAGDYRASVRFFLSGYGLTDDALEGMLSSPAGESMLAAARVLPYDHAMLGDGIVPTDLAAKARNPTLVLAAEDQPSTARPLSRR